MAKLKTRFVCQECGYETPKWMGRCPGCGAWNTLVEEAQPGVAPERPSFGGISGGKVLPITEVEFGDEERFSSGIGELDRVLGGGIVPGSLTLVGGDPGIGKSTLVLQACNFIAQSQGPVLYVSGEESPGQVRLRAGRIGAISPGILVVSETDVSAIERHIITTGPKLVVIDSIQTVYRNELSSAPGSVAQVREATSAFMRIAKESGIPVFIIGHVTKSGAIAGPRVLEHMVDTVLYFEGERHHAFRILRATKNRFGSTNEIGVFEMRESGLLEVENPSSLFLGERPPGVSGSVVVASMEGSRPILTEVQALVCSAGYGVPRRTSMGVDYNRVAIILAVLEKRAGLILGAQDVYVSAAGGVKIDEPASDLGIAIAVASSFRNRPVGQHTVAIGEVGLLGEVRSVSRVDVRIGEAQKLGYKRIVIPYGNQKSLSGTRGDIELLGVKTVSDALSMALEV